MLLNIVKPLLSDIKTYILDILFPIYCLACETEGKEFLCEICKNSLSPSKQICIICKKPSPAGLTHPNCKNSNSPEGFISFFDYRDPKVSKLIIVGKYYFVKDIYKTLGQMLAAHLKTDYPSLMRGYQLTPIPLYWMRQNWRGFNQSEITCQELGRHLNLQLENLLVRTHWTKTQKNLKKESRRSNVTDAFSLSPNFTKTLNSPYPLQGQSFLLVDDVVTTGSTILEAAKVLKKNGAEKVWCLAIARD